MKKYLIFITFLFFASKMTGQQKQEYYKEVDKKSVESYYLRYFVKVPNNWFSYKTDPNLMAHSPIEFKDSINSKGIFPSVIIRKNIFKGRTLEKNLKAFLRFHENTYPKFQYILVEANHKMYGKYYNIKFSLIKKEGIELIMASIFSINKKNYIFFYSSSDSNFDRYLNEVLNMVNSFEIIKN